MFNIIIMAAPVTVGARAGQADDWWCGCVALDSAVINFKTKFNSLSLVSQSQANVFLLDKNPIFLVHLFPLHILATESVKFQHNLSTTIFLTSVLSLTLYWQRHSSCPHSTIDILPNNEWIMMKWHEGPLAWSLARVVSVLLLLISMSILWSWVTF